MKIFKYLSLAFFLLISTTIIGATPQIIVAGSYNSMISILDKNTKDILWQHSLEAEEECNSVYLMPGNNILFSTKNGARMVSLDHQIMWSYTLDKPGEVQSVIPMSNGGFALAVCGNPARIIEFSPTYQEVKSISFDGGVRNAHGQFRQIVQSKKGTWLIPLFAKKAILELSPMGDLIREIALDANPFSLTEIGGNRWLVPCCDGHFIAVIDAKTGNLISKISDFTNGSSKILFAAQVVPTNKHHYMLSNWSGHFKGELKDMPQLIEFDLKGNLSWSYEGHATLGRVSALYYSKKPLIAPKNR